MPYGSDIIMLNCTKCGANKPESSFYDDIRNTKRSGKRTFCIDCDKTRGKKYKAENHKKVSARVLEYRRIKHRYFEPGMFDERLAEQGGVCAICKTDTPGGKGTFHADHDHKKLKPRGVLCHNCNVALGNFQDNPELLQAAIEYLNKYMGE